MGFFYVPPADVQALPIPAAEANAIARDVISDMSDSTYHPVAVSPSMRKGLLCSRVTIWRWNNRDPRRFDVWIGPDGKVVESKDTTITDFANVTAKTRFFGDQPARATPIANGFSLSSPYVEVREGFNQFPRFNYDTIQTIESPNDIIGDGLNYGENPTDSKDNARTPAGEALFGIQRTAEFYAKFLGRNGFDDRGSKMEAFVHAGDHYANAFYAQGLCECLYFGDGNWAPGVGGFALINMTDLEIAGHEWSHSVTANTARLDYFGEAGGLNEATSDIFGKAIAFWAQAGYPETIPTPLSLDSWTIGYNVFYFNGVQKPFRYFYKPSRDWAYYGSVGSADVVNPSAMLDMDPHFASGPLNRWFFICSVGIPTYASHLETSSEWLQEGLNYPIGVQKTVQVWYRALSAKLGPSASYHDAAIAVDRAAGELFGSQSRERAAVNAGMLAVHAIDRQEAHIRPTITAFEPAGPFNPGDSLTIHGGGFNQNTRVSFNEIYSPIDSFNESSLSFTIPNNAISGFLSIQNEMGPSNSIQIDIYGQPAILRFLADPKVTHDGEPLTIDWRTSNGSASLNGVAVVPNGFRVSYPSPRGDSSYTLSVVNPGKLTITQTITVYYRPYDINRDGKIDLLDLLYVAANDPRADMNGDGIVDDSDLNAIIEKLPK